MDEPTFIERRFTFPLRHQLADDVQGRCPTHGVQMHYLHIRGYGDLDGRYCMVCFNDWMGTQEFAVEVAQHVTKLEPIETVGLGPNWPTERPKD